MSFWAIHKNTKQRINSVAVEYSDNFMKQEGWFADPIDIEECPNDININEIPVVYVKQSKLIELDNGNIYFRSPHFKRKPDKKYLLIKFKKRSKQHETIQQFICNYIQNNKLKYTIDGKDFYSFDFNFESLNIEEHRNHKFKTIRADVFIQFKKPDPFFGRGIIYEIQLSEQDDRTYIERSYDRALINYSVIWINNSDLKYNLEKNNFILKNNTLKIISVNSLLKEYSKLMMNDLKEYFANYIDMINKRIDKFNQLKAQLENFVPDSIKCKLCKNYMLLKRGVARKTGNPYAFYECTNCNNKWWLNNETN